MKRLLDEIYLGVLTKDGRFECFTEKQVRKTGGGAKGELFYHHRAVFSRLSKLKDWQEVITDDENLRFNRITRYTHRDRFGDDIHIAGKSTFFPYDRKSRKQISQLARLLIKKGIKPETRLKVPEYRLSRTKAPYQNEFIGTVGEFAKGGEFIKMADFRSLTKKEAGGAPGVVIKPEGATLDSLGVEENYKTPYVQLRGGRVGEVDIWIREDLLRRVP